MSVIKPADILLPKNKSYEKWSAIACDQFTSDKSYWDKAEKIVGDEPSTLRMIYPEAWIGEEKGAGLEEKISKEMKRCLKEKLFSKREQAYMLVKRHMKNGTIRTGFIGAIDLEQYEYKPDADALVKATEKTVQERLYKRLDVRKKASVEFPHVLVFYNDPEKKTDAWIENNKEHFSLEYSFELMLGGGKIEGYSISGNESEKLTEFFAELENRAIIDADIDKGIYPVMLAIGDGNHSLATAKLSWDVSKQQMTEEERESCPARYALVELINVYDTGISIEPIHRLIFNSATESFVAHAKDYFGKIGGTGAEKEIIVGNGSAEERIIINGLSAGDITAECDSMIEEYLRLYGGEEDYIHGNEEVRRLGNKPGSAYVILPSIERDEIFKTAAEHTIFPKKCFSIGHAEEKRYYIEGRKII